MSYFFPSTSSTAPTQKVLPSAAAAAAAAPTEAQAATASSGDVTAGCAYAPPALIRRMGRTTRSQRRKSGPTERVWSLQTPISWKLPNLDNAVYKVNDRFLVNTLLSNIITNVYSAYNFVVNSMGNISALQTLFDQYRIVGVEVMICPQVNFIAAGTTATAGMLHSVVDYDDGTVLTSEQAALDYQNCLSSSFSDGHYRKFIPHAALAAYSGAFTSYNNVVSPWIDAAYPSVNHFGVKTVVTTASTASTALVYATLFTEWRNVR